MATFPLPLTELLGHYGSYIVYLLIGFSFGYVLEIALKRKQIITDVSWWEGLLRFSCFSIFSFEFFFRKGKELSKDPFKCRFLDI